MCCISRNHCLCFFFFFSAVVFIYFCVCIIFLGNCGFDLTSLSVLSTFLPSTPFTARCSIEQHTNKRTNNDGNSLKKWQTKRAFLNAWLWVFLKVSNISKIIDSFAHRFIQSLWFRSQGILYFDWKCTWTVGCHSKFPSNTLHTAISIFYQRVPVDLPLNLCVHM